MRKLLTCLAFLFFGSTAHAQWYVDFDGTVAMSPNQSIAITCSHAFGGPTLEVFTTQRISPQSNPRVTFVFDGAGRMEWTAMHVAEIYAGPLEGPYGNSTQPQYTLRFAFDNFGEALGHWLSVVEWFEQHDAVAFEFGSNTLGPFSLQGAGNVIQSVRAQSQFRC
ncbi:hypothetical protein [Nioella aestuarii]|uniref:hypothetical protein n=1 Tax=Nioella aestuarii TaxID=1662864 RepID=UPI003D7FFF7F